MLVIFDAIEYFMKEISTFYRFDLLYFYYLSDYYLSIVKTKSHESYHEFDLKVNLLDIIRHEN